MAGRKYGRKFRHPSDSRGRHRPLMISQSLIDVVLSCQRKAFYKYVERQPKMTDYARIAGICAHKVIKRLERPAPDGRRFFLKTLKGACKTYWRFWYEALEENASRIITPREESATHFGAGGVISVAQYWKQNIDVPRPVEVEQRYFLPSTQWGFPAVGYLDQVRAVTLDWIAGHRPELVRGGALVDGYAPVVILDLKTSAHGYDVRHFLGNATPEEIVRRQYPLLVGIQQTFYAWLYHQVRGVKPVAFLWCHLRSGKTFPTYPDDKDYPRLFEEIDTAVRILAGNVESEFPRHVGDRCAWCDYLRPCAPPDLRGVEPEDLHAIQSPSVTNLPYPPPDPARGKQLRLQFPRGWTKRELIPPILQPPEATAPPPAG